MEDGLKVTASMVERMKREAKGMRKELGQQHSAALEVVAQQSGFASWRMVTVSATRHALTGPTPPVGTPTASHRPGNSTPAAAPVAGINKSPVISPVSVE